MKVISAEEERAHYNTVLKGGLIGGSLGLGIGLIGVLGGGRRFPAVRQLTLPFQAFLITSAGTAGAIINAERYSNAFHLANNPMNFYKDQASRDAALARAHQSSWERFMDWGKANRYTIIGLSWLGSISASMAIVSRNKYLTMAQKIVQARVYAQGLTIAVLIATAAFETADARQGKGRWETIKVVDPNDPEHKKLIEKRIHKEEYEGQDLWRDMVESEERRLAALKKEREEKKNTKTPAPPAESESEAPKKNAE
ncbi:mitochondrial hypoxia responsive domain-containing protein [Poronia punctata]|nr:mitochondrial hypoxia responsive domain-containing protein [Poronia punctata]